MDAIEARPVSNTFKLLTLLLTMSCERQRAAMSSGAGVDSSRVVESGLLGLLVGQDGNRTYCEGGVGQAIPW